MDPGPALPRLFKDGYAIVPVFLPQQDIAARMMRARANFIEYNLGPGSEPLAQHIQGPAGLLGNPSSFHHPSVRYVRSYCKREVGKVVADWVRDSGKPRELRMEMLFERLAVRPASYLGTPSMKRDAYPAPKAVSAGEGAHIPALLADDVMLGGWVNCSLDLMQTVQIVPNSYLDVKPDGEEDPTAVDPELVDQYDKKTLIVDVPPGCCLVMRYGTAYREAKLALAPDADMPDMRMFLAFRLTTDRHHLFPEQQAWMDDQAVPRIGNGCFPPMYSSRPRAQQVEEWATAMFRRECLSAHPRGFKVPAPPHSLDTRRMDSLRALNLGMFPPYTLEERKVMSPEPILPQ
jgi:hypothetical protein